MKKLLFVLMMMPALAFAEVIASMPNQAGGKIVLTDEECNYNNKKYPTLRKSYFYTPEGITGDGCWRVDDETVIVVWFDSNGTRRYPIENFNIRKRSGRNL